MVQASGTTNKDSKNFFELVNSVLILQMSFLWLWGKLPIAILKSNGVNFAIFHQKKHPMV